MLRHGIPGQITYIYNSSTETEAEGWQGQIQHELYIYKEKAIVLCTFYPRTGAGRDGSISEPKANLVSISELKSIQGNIVRPCLLKKKKSIPC